MIFNRTTPVSKILETLKFGKRQIPNGKISEGMFRWHGWFSGLEPNSKCSLRIFANNGRIIAIGQQLLGEVTTSITNDVENLATCVYEMCRKEFGLTSVNEFQWIEYYTRKTNILRKDHYSLVEFDWDGKNFTNPDWNKKGFEEIRAIIGVDPPESIYHESPTVTVIS